MLRELRDYATIKCSHCVNQCVTCINNNACCDTSSCVWFVGATIILSISFVIAIWFSLVIRLLSVIIDNNDNKKTRHRI